MYLLILPFALAIGYAHAADYDEDALTLADNTKTEVVQTRSWRAFLEVASVHERSRTGGTRQFPRASVDFHQDMRLREDWRFILANRTDLELGSGPSYENTVNTLKEAYVSWRPHASFITDLGRINTRYGVAMGYNPTDYFRAGALRSVVSIDPASLRENRLGSVMWRNQWLWDTGSLTLIFSPKLADDPNESPFDIDLGATNHQNRWLAVLSHKVGANIHPQWLLYGQEKDLTQIGLNLSTLLNNATIVFLEGSFGRERSLLEYSRSESGRRRSLYRVAGGATITAPNKISLTVEYDYNEAALRKKDWEALSLGTAGTYARYRESAQFFQDPPTRHNLFLYTRWEDAFIPNLDITNLMRIDLDDDSRLFWIEARYPWERFDVALQWQQNSGRDGSQYGALPTYRSWTALIRYFF